MQAILANTNLQLKILSHKQWLHFSVDEAAKIQTKLKLMTQTQFENKKFVAYYNHL